MDAEYAQRRQRLMDAIGHGTAIFVSAPEVVDHRDVEHVFRQESDFYYLSGFAEPEALMVLAPQHPEHRFVLFVRPRDRAAETWTGHRAGIEGAKERYGADAAYPIGELDEKLPQYLSQADTLYYSFGHNEKFNDIVLKHWRQLLRGYPVRGTGPTAIADANLLLSELRLRKSPRELDMMRRAAAISAEAHNRARLMAAPGVWEHEVQAELEFTFRKHGALRPAYPSIVASGANACILHYVENNRQMQAGDLLLIDAGCCYGYYNADITRTFPVSGQFTAAQKTLYDIVLRAQLAAIAAVQPGNPYAAPHEAAVSTIVDGLMDLGLLRGDKEEIVKEGKYRPYFMHRTGHWLGMDVHDVGRYKRDAETWYTFEPGMVLTIEPGLYIGPETEPAEGQPPIPDVFRGIGIRIEDDVLVTESGHENLTAAVPKAIEDLERA